MFFQLIEFIIKYKFENHEQAKACKEEMDGKCWPESFSAAIKVEIINLEQANQ